MRIEIPVSIGELIDKITILELKSDRIADQDKRRVARHELDALNLVLDRVMPPESVGEMVEELREVNGRLWDLEDRIRELDARQDFGADFVTSARAIYRQNDRRFAIKAAINAATGSEIGEVKSYQGTRHGTQ